MVKKDALIFSLAGHHLLSSKLRFVQEGARQGIEKIEVQQRVKEKNRASIKRLKGKTLGFSEFFGDGS
jgi:hypothetical protein